MPTEIKQIKQSTEAVNEDDQAWAQAVEIELGLSINDTEFYALARAFAGARAEERARCLAMWDKPDAP